MRAMAITLAVGGFLGISTAFGATNSVAPDAKTAEDRAALDEACTHTACRPDRAITLKTDTERSITFNFARTPYVDKSNVLYAYPGEMLMFHVEVDGNAVRPPVFVREESVKTGDVSLLEEREKAGLDGKDPGTPAFRQAVADWKANVTMKDRLAKAPPGTLYVFYRQIPGGPSMILETGHNLGPMLKFDATISRPGHEGFRFEHSSTCGVMSGLGSIETWPYVLGPVMLENIRLAVPQKNADGRTTVSCD
jgi:hypothetical protein